MTHANPLRDPQDRRLPRIAGPCGMVLFGVTGDLSRKKVMPAIYDLANRGLLPPGFSLVGFARRDWADQDFAQIVHDAVKEHARTPFREEVWNQLSEGFRFVSGRLRRRRRLRPPAPHRRGARPAARHRRQHGLLPRRSRPPFFGTVVGQLKEHGLADPGPEQWRRVVVEKPFGHDLESARELNRTLDGVFPSGSVFRIDHYLGKETVQNILAMRFANNMFEPIWNANYVDHVQITMAEDIGIGGRAGYYDGIGAARDVIQNHLLQLMALVAMEEPIAFDARSLRIEKQKVLDVGHAAGASRPAPPPAASTPPAGPGGEKVQGFLEEEGIPKTSTTETFAAITRRRRHPPLGRRAVLPAHRQAARPARHRGRRRLQARAAPAVRADRDRGAGAERPRHPGAARRGHDDALRRRRCPAPRWRSATSTWTSPTAAPSPRPRPRRTSGSSSTSCSATRRCSRGTRRSSCRWKILDPIIDYWAAQGQAGAVRRPAPGVPTSADKMLARDGRTWRRP